MCIRDRSKTTLFDSRIKKYAYREAAQLYGELGSSPAGLSPEQVEPPAMALIPYPTMPTSAKTLSETRPAP